MAKVIAICGKGGAGKTTVSALLARALLGRKKMKVLLVDADPAGGLGLALHFPVKRSLNQIRTQTIQTIKKGVKHKKELALSLDYLLMEALSEKGNLAFLSLGQPEEPGCYCPVNNLLRDSLGILAQQFDLAIIDAEAGMEQVSRRVMSRVEFLVLVSEPSLKGIRVAEAIKKVAERLSPKAQSALLLNRLSSPTEYKKIRAFTTLKIMGGIPEDETLRQFDAKGLCFFELPDCPASQAVVKAFKKAKII